MRVLFSSAVRCEPQRDRRRGIADGLRRSLPTQRMSKIFAFCKTFFAEPLDKQKKILYRMHTIYILQEVFMISDEEILRKAKTEREIPVEEVIRLSRDFTGWEVLKARAQKPK